jgi:hypothetical protein
MPPTSRSPLGGRAAAAAAAVILLVAVVSQASAASDHSPRATPLRSWQVIAPGWTPSDKELGRVDDILRVGRRVFIGGNFTEMAGHGGRTAARMHIAAVNAANGGLLPHFHPRINGRVYALAVSPSGRLLFVGGQFSAVGPHPRHNFAAFDLRTNKLSSRVPDLGVSGIVRGIAVSQQGRVYLGGTFGSVAGRPRAHLAKLVAVKGRYRLNARWHPSTNGEVRDIVVSQATSTVVVGGEFSDVNGSGGQDNIAALGAKAGRLQQWVSHPGSIILDLALCGNRIYAAMGGPGGTALDYGLHGGRKWYYMTDGNVQAVSCVSHMPVFGMHGDYVAPRKNQPLVEHGSSKRIQRHKLFLLSKNGVLRKWNPNVFSTAGVLGVWALASGKGNLYVGGDFTGIHGVGQQRFAILPRR